MTMLLPLFILVGFIAGYFVNAIAYHLSPLEDKTALTFRQVLVHFRQKKFVRLCASFPLTRSSN